MLSRVAPHDACLATSTSGNAVLGEQPLLLGDDQRRSIRQRDVAERSPWSLQVPRLARTRRPGNSFAPRPGSAAVPAALFRSARRLIFEPANPPLVVLVVIVCVVLLGFSLSTAPLGAAACSPVRKKQKAAPEAHVCDLPQDSGFAGGPSLDLPRPEPASTGLSIQASCQFCAVRKTQLFHEIIKNEQKLSRSLFACAKGNWRIFMHCTIYRQS